MYCKSLLVCSGLYLCMANAWYCWWHRVQFCFLSCRLGQPFALSVYSGELTTTASKHHLHTGTSGRDEVFSQLLNWKWRCNHSLSSERRNIDIDWTSRLYITTLNSQLSTLQVIFWHQIWITTKTRLLTTIDSFQCTLTPSGWQQQSAALFMCDFVVKLMQTMWL